MKKIMGLNFYIENLRNASKVSNRLMLDFSKFLSDGKNTWLEIVARDEIEHSWLAKNDKW